MWCNVLFWHCVLVCFHRWKNELKNCLTKEHWVKTGLDHCHSHWIQHWRFSGLKGTEDNSGHHQPALELGDPPSFMAGIWVIQSLPNHIQPRSPHHASESGSDRYGSIALRFRIECVTNMYKNKQRATKKKENNFNIFNLMVQMQVCGGIAGWYGSMICGYDLGVRSHTVHRFFWGVAVFLCSCNWETQNTRVLLVLIRTIGFDLQLGELVWDLLGIKPVGHIHKDAHFGHLHLFDRISLSKKRGLIQREIRTCSPSHTCAHKHSLHTAHCT